MLALMQSLMLTILECMSKAIQVDIPGSALGGLEACLRHAEAYSSPCCSCFWFHVVLHGNAGQTLVVCLRFSEDKAMFLLR